jgi:hypothetical protein
MRTLLTVAVWVLSLTTTIAQEPNVENFKRYRAQMVERLKGTEGRPLNSNLVLVFGVPDDIRILTDAEMVFTGRRLTLTFSTNATDLFLTDSRKTSSGTVVTVFHTDLTLVLRAAASGVSASDLQRIAKNDDAENQFREVLLRWDRELPQMLDRSKRLIPNP